MKSKKSSWDASQYEMGEEDRKIIYEVINLVIPTVEYEENPPDVFCNRGLLEDMVIKKDLVERMSSEAQDVLELLTNSQRITSIYCSYGRIDQKGLIKFMRKIGSWEIPDNKIKSIFEEIKRTLKEMV